MQMNISEQSRALCILFMEPNFQTNLEVLEFEKNVPKLEP